MILEGVIKDAYLESIKKVRKGDKEEEVEAIKNKILSAKRIIVATNNQKKFKIIKNIMLKFVKDAEIKMTDIDTSFADLTRMPAIFKALMAVDVENGDIYIARGRLGIPGSGAMLVILDNKGRILTASLSPPSSIHKEKIEKRIEKEIIEALNRVGIK
ncbi:FeGP cofactor biosynthesis guanylyltransferase HcgB family protein [Methanocaldococcus villosus]|nr:FeGP cofactor biosynthesis guanylyltransferase HcgB family protein [Methanocaldococcus villosus]